jgi:hypothetical protein
VVVEPIVDLRHEYFHDCGQPVGGLRVRIDLGNPAKQREQRREECDDSGNEN